MQDWPRDRHAGARPLTSQRQAGGGLDGGREGVKPTGCVTVALCAAAVHGSSPCTPCATSPLPRPSPSHQAPRPTSSAAPGPTAPLLPLPTLRGGSAPLPSLGVSLCSPQSRSAARPARTPRGETRLPGGHPGPWRLPGRQVQRRLGGFGCGFCFLFFSFALDERPVEGGLRSACPPLRRPALGLLVSRLGLRSRKCGFQLLAVACGA